MGCLALSLVTGCSKGPIGSLRPHRTAEINLHRSGCFSSVNYHFTFVRDAAKRVSVTIIETRNPGSRDNEKASVYEGTLSDAEEKAIDSELAEAAATPEGGCTSQDRFDVSAPGTFGSVKRSQFEDSSCSRRARGLEHLTEVHPNWRRP